MNKDIVEVTVNSQISAAHLVQTDDSSPCSHLHGHNWKIQVELKGYIGKDGMLIDKNEIDELIKQLDHRTIIPNNLIKEKNEYEVTVEHNDKRYILPVEDVIIIEEIDVVTSENMAKEIARTIFNKNINILEVEVKVSESDSLTASYLDLGGC